jgi:putative endonuclease
MLKRLLGLDFEARAERWLVARGLRPVTRNWHCRFGEIDLVMHDGDTLVFVEVRQRSSRAFGGAAASVTPAKQKKLLAAARLYLASLPREPACRFDVFAWDGTAAPDWIKNAFDDAG